MHMKALLNLLVPNDLALNHQDDWRRGGPRVASKGLQQSMLGAEFSRSQVYGGWEALRGKVASVRLDPPSTARTVQFFAHML